MGAECVVVAVCSFIKRKEVASQWIGDLSLYHSWVSVRHGFVQNRLGRGLKKLFLSNKRVEYAIEGVSNG
ncbi:hypothetical protein [Bartonella sp. B1098]|uniref:hypothetical protein n=1 Tax=Bartonella sp. B1098 TaxID=2911421 RepID=UPI0020C371DC|nr:hypothetical protein [Bartonella sp. B1098]